MKKNDYINGFDFHNSNPKIYKLNNEPADNYFKQSDRMAKVVYQKAHENSSFIDSDPRHGIGNNFCKWITSEQNDTAENFSFNKNLNGILESYLEPNASIGWHKHIDTEEYYYMLEGNLFVECLDNDNVLYQKEIKAGDLHRISKGMSHYAKAGLGGAKFLAIIVKAS